MKKITLLIALLITSLGFSQQQEYIFDFEDDGPDGTASNWLTFDNEPAAAEIVDNPDLDGVNATASKVLKVVMGPGNAFYAGVNNGWEQSAFGTWKIDMAVPSNLTLTMDVNKNYVGTVGIKMATNTGGTTFQITDQNVGNTVVDEWQTITFDLSGINPNGDLSNISQLVIFVDWTQDMPDRAEGSTIYIDNVKFGAEKLTDPAVSGGSGSSTAPTDAPGTPTLAEADVISIFSDAYTDLAATWNPGWGQSTVLADETIASNPVKKYSSLNFTGIEPTAGTIDATSMTHINLDYWTSDAAEIKFKLVDYKGDGAWGADNSEFEVTKTTTTGDWVTLSIPLTEYTGISFNDIGQLVLSATGATNPVYIDNIYFSNGEATSGGGSVAIAPTDAPAVPTLAEADVISIFSDAYTDLVSTWNPGWGQSTVLADETIASNAVKKYSSLNFTGIEPTAGTVDATAMTHINLDYWTSDATEIKFKLVDYNGDGAWGADNSESEVTKTATTGAWVTLSIPFTEFLGISFNDIGQFVLSATDAVNPVYIDNIYFSNTSVLSTSSITLEELSFYPNPTSRNLNISAANNIKNVEIYNVLGKKMMKVIINKTSDSIDVSNLASGIYLIKYNINDAIGTAKFIKK
ncbi:T9SS type A sorting domain-containing protein [Polaribacter sp. Asnod6-C07]|uniref:T9SS type A sorting domain-containing protein n=1 Tax=Polaribacter sp. Asnod6-C07 TaxID=3160582 RepID=UPI0038650B75